MSVASFLSVSDPVLDGEVWLKDTALERGFWLLKPWIHWVCSKKDHSTERVLICSEDSKAMDVPAGQTGSRREWGVNVQKTMVLNSS